MVLCLPDCRQRDDDAVSLRLCSRGINRRSAAMPRCGVWQGCHGSSLESYMNVWQGRRGPLPSSAFVFVFANSQIYVLCSCRFKGQHRDKLRITFKVEGDGFMADALCNDGYCYQIYFRNDPAPKKYIDMGLSPLLARTMFLFDALRDAHHCCGMDNLYNSAAFC